MAANRLDELRSEMTDLILSVADDKLMLGHRNSDWTGLGPILEEDIASSSIAQDEIAHAQALSELVAPLTDRTADQLAYGRDATAFRCATIVERSDDFDWATALARRFFCDHFDVLRLERLAASSWPDLAALAASIGAEERVHVEHIDGWIRRLGRAKTEAHDRIQGALRELTRDACMLVEPVTGEAELVDAGLYPELPAGSMYDAWASAITSVTESAQLNIKLAQPATDVVGGRRGTHTPDLTELLDEMCEVWRLEPDATW